MRRQACWYAIAYVAALHLRAYIWRGEQGGFTRRVRVVLLVNRGGYFSNISGICAIPLKIMTLFFMPLNFNIKIIFNRFNDT